MKNRNTKAQPAVMFPLESRQLLAATLAGTVFGTAGVPLASLAQATDGDLSTFLDAPQADGATVGVNLGSPKSVGQIAFAPRDGFANRMIGGFFQASNDPTFATGVRTFGKIRRPPKVGKLTIIGTGSGKAYQYWRYVAPAGSYGDVAEVQLYAPAGSTASTASGVLTGTATFGTAGSFHNGTNTIDKATDDNRATFFNGPTADGDIVGIDLGAAEVVDEIAFAPRAGFAKRMVGGAFQASNDPSFSTNVIAVDTLTAAPAGNRVTTAATGTPVAYRYWRYVAPADSYGNIAEFQLYADGATPQVPTTVIVSPAADQSATTAVAHDFDLGSFNAANATGPYAIDVNWGDGSVDTDFTVADVGAIGVQTHTYAAAGSDTVTLTLTNAAADVSASARFTATVTDPTPTTTPTTLAITPATDQSATMAADHAFDLGSFTASNATAPYTVDVDWGDGSDDTTVYVADPGAIPAQTHNYAAAGTDIVTLIVGDSAGHTSAATPATFTVTVADGSPTTTPTTTITVTPPAAQAATAATGQLFNLGSINASNATAPFTVTVGWGDGSADTTFQAGETGTIDPQAHAYAAVGTDAATVTVADSAGHVSSAATFTVTVAVAAATPTPTPTPTPTDFTQITWTTAAPGPVTRSEALKATVGGKLYVFGGFDTNAGPMLRSDVYDPATNTWTRIHDLPEELTHVGMAVYGTLVYFVGGYVGVGNNTFAQTFGTRDVWIYDTVANTFSAGPSLPAAYAGGGAAIVGHTLHYFGGFLLNRSDTNLHLTLDLDNPSADWQTAPSMPMGLSHMGAVEYGGKIYAIAGQTGYDAGLVTQSVVQIFDPTTNTWTYGANMPAPRSHTASATFIMGDRIIVMGGESADEVQAAQCYAYTPATNTWVALTSLPAPRFSGVADVFNGKIIFTSGGNSNTTYDGTPVST